MRIRHCFIFVPVLLAAAPWPALAQQEVCRDIPIPAIDEPRVVTECRRPMSEGGTGLEAVLMPQQEMEALRLLIPGYSPGDGENHVYELTFFSDNGVGNTSLFPDEYGYVQVDLPASLRGQGEQAAEPAMLISSANVETGEIRLSMDVSDVLAGSFVNALFNARMNLDGSLAMLRGEPRRRPFQDGPPPRNDLVLGDRRISLRGENLGLEEALDLLYQVSGCSVFLEENYLVAKSCR